MWSAQCLSFLFNVSVVSYWWIWFYQPWKLYRGSVATLHVAQWPICWAWTKPWKLQTWHRQGRGQVCENKKMDATQWNECVIRPGSFVNTFLFESNGRHPSMKKIVWIIIYVHFCMDKLRSWETDFPKVKPGNKLEATINGRNPVALRIYENLWNHNLTNIQKQGKQPNPTGSTDFVYKPPKIPVRCTTA